MERYIPDTREIEANIFAVEAETTGQESEITVELTPAEIVEAQGIWAAGRGYDSWEHVSPIERAEFWAIEGNHKEAGEAALEAGLDRPSQLKLMVKATGARLGALSYVVDGEHQVERDEFAKVDEIQQGLLAELAQLEVSA